MSAPTRCGFREIGAVLRELVLAIDREGFEEAGTVAIAEGIVALDHPGAPPWAATLLHGVREAIELAEAEHKSRRLVRVYFGHGRAVQVAWSPGEQLRPEKAEEIQAALATVFGGR